jgi:phospholipase A-2-activating protein
VQSIVHPTISVWTVAVLSNGDIVSGASDAVVRVWTRNPARLASAELREKLERDLRSRTLNKTQVGDVNTTDLPGREALKRPGKQCISHASLLHVLGLHNGGPQATRRVM